MKLLINKTIVEVFPRVTKCRFNKFGPSGSIQELDALCVLPLNMYNEKIFVFLWFWFSIVAILCFYSIVVKIVLIVCPFARFHYIRFVFMSKRERVRQRSLRPVDTMADTHFDEKDFNFGEIFVFSMV